MLNLALGVYFKAHNQLTNTTEHWLKALDFAPKAWELHRLLGKVLLLQYHDDALREGSSNPFGTAQSLPFI